MQPQTSHISTGTCQRAGPCLGPLDLPGTQQAGLEHQATELPSLGTKGQNSNGSTEVGKGTCPGELLSCPIREGTRLGHIESGVGCEWLVALV